MQKNTEVSIGTKSSLSFRHIEPRDKVLLGEIVKLSFILDLPPIEPVNALVVAEFLTSEFKWATFEDLKEAIFKAKAGKLDVNSSDYNKLSLDFLGRVLNAYRDYKAKENLNTPKPNLEEVVKIDYNDALTKEQEQKEAYEWILKVVTEEKKLPFIALWNEAFVYMEKIKLIYLSTDEKLLFQEIVLEEIKHEIKKRRVLRTDYSDLRVIVENPKQLAGECRKRLVIKHFENYENNSK